MDDEITPLKKQDASNYSYLGIGEDIGRQHARSASDTSCLLGPDDHHRGDGLRVTFDSSAGNLPEDEIRTSERQRGRSSSFMESFGEIKEVIVDTIGEVKEVIEEGFEEIRDEIKEVLEEPIVPIKPREEGDHSQKLSAIVLAVLVFYKVSGGPFGCEPAIRAAGPFVGLLGFIIFPLIWAMPEALVTAELGSAFPEPSGSIAWVEEAFGPHAGLLCGYFHWVSGVTDNAIYPSLFLEYVSSFLSSEANLDMSNELMRFFFCIVMTVVLAYFNYRGLEIVGNLAVILAIVSLSPFVLMCILGAPKIKVSRWFVLPKPVPLQDDNLGASWFADPVWLGIMWRPFLNSLFWNLNSFDVGASFAGEVRDPERVFPRAMFISIALVSFSYIFPLMVAIGAVDSSQDDWKAGFLATLSGEIGGHFVVAWLVFAAAISNIGLFEAEMSGDAYQLMGMSDRGLIPKLFQKRNRFGSPTVGITVGTCAICLLSFADFDSLVEMLNFAYCLSMIMEFAAFVKLRITDDDVERPYKIPLGTTGCILFVIPPIILCAYLMFIASRMTYMYFTILMTFGLLFHLVQKAAKHHKYWEYAEPPPKKTKRKTMEPLLKV